MNLVLQELDEFIDIARKYANNVDINISNRKNDFRSMCFWNIHNRAILTKEIVEIYQNKYENNGPSSDIKPEIMERIIIVTRDMFIDTVSSVERAIKNCTSAYKTSCLREKSLDGYTHLYLRNIISTSMKLGYITRETFDEWDNILTIRNLVTHNNSIADRSKTFKLGSLRINMRPNRMMKGPPDTFVILTSRITKLFYDWLVDIDGMFK